MNDERLKALLALHKLANAIVDAVREAGPQGAPGGLLYAALMQHVTLRQFEQVMDGLVGARKLRRQGDLYFIESAVKPPVAAASRV